MGSEEMKEEEKREEMCGEENRRNEKGKSSKEKSRKRRPAMNESTYLVFMARIRLKSLPSSRLFCKCFRTFENHMI